MIDEQARKAILDSLDETLENIEKNRIPEGLQLANRENLSAITDASSGLMKIKASIRNRFRFTITKPEALSMLYATEIRCCLCHKIISYPCWYYTVKFAINNFHYFVCFSPDSPSVVNMDCLKKG